MLYRLREERLKCSPAESDLRLLVDGKLNMSQQYVPVAKMTNCILACIKYNTAKQSKEIIVSLYSSLLRTHLEHCGLHNIRIQKYNSVSKGGQQRRQKD